MGNTLRKVMKDLPEKRRKDIEQRADVLIREYKTLQELRRSLGLTQSDVATIQGVNQVNISNFENREDMLLSTLENYVKALGCKLKIFVETPDGKRVKIENLSNNEESAED